MSQAVGDIAAYSDGVAGISVLSDEDAVAAFLHGVFAGDLYGGVQVIFDGVRVVGGDFQDDVRMALDHGGLFLVGMCRGSRWAQASGPGHSRGGGKRWLQRGCPAFSDGAVAAGRRYSAGWIGGS